MKRISIVFLFLLASWGFNQESYGKLKSELEKPEIKDLSFGNITVNGIKYDTDVVIDGGESRERKKGPSRVRRSEFGHTPLTPEEKIPWDCDTLVIGIGMSSRLPVVDELKKEAEKRGVELVLLETPKAVKYFQDHYSKRTNAIFHVTC